MIKKSIHTLNAALVFAGISPKKALDLRMLPRYWRDVRKFRGQGGEISKYFPILSDYNDKSGVAKGPYFHQDLLVAQFIYESKPENHADVGSRVDGFVAHIATFRRIDVLDIRPLETSEHSNIRFVQADLMSVPSDLIGRYDSVSSLHALEHFGLGRYTDPIAADGHLRGFRAVLQMVRPGGRLYVSFPIGRPRVEFNAHRVFRHDEVLAWASGQIELERFDFVDDSGNLHKDQTLSAAASGLDHGCGIYTLRRLA